MIIQLVPQFNCSPNFWQFWHISTFKGAIPWSQKELQHLPPAGRAVEGEGEGWDANEGGKQGGDAPQGPGAGCRAKGTFSQVQPENDFRSEMHWHFVKIALLDYVCFEILDFPGSAGGWSAPFQNLKKRWNFFPRFLSTWCQEAGICVQTWGYSLWYFFCAFSLMHWNHLEAPPSDDDDEAVAWDPQWQWKPAADGLPLDADSD